MALAPGDGDDGCWSGSLAGGVIFYTSVAEPTWTAAGSAGRCPTDDDWTAWTKQDVVVEPPPEATHFRDPFVHRDADGWRMVVGCATEDGPAVWSYRSDDLERWRPEGVVASRPRHRRGPERPGSARPCSRSTVARSCWSACGSRTPWTAWPTRSAPPTRRGCNPGPFRRLSYGPSYYAASVFTDRHGRPGIVAWLRGVADIGAGWAGATSLPALVSLRGDRLVLTPPTETAAWSPAVGDRLDEAAFTLTARDRLAAADRGRARGRAARGTARRSASSWTGRCSSCTATTGSPPYRSRRRHLTRVNSARFDGARDLRHDHQGRPLVRRERRALGRAPRRHLRRPRRRGLGRAARRDRLPRGRRRHRPVGACRAWSTSTPTTTSRCSTGPALDRVGAPRRHHDPARLLLALDRARRRRRRRRPVRPGRGDPAPARHPRPSRSTRTWAVGRRVRRGARVAAARPQPGGVHRPLRHAHRGDGPGPGHPQGRRARPGASRPGWRRCSREALDAGFVGMSAQQLLFDKLDGDLCRSRTLPSTYAKRRELKPLRDQLRRRGRVLQAGPDVKHPQSLVTQAFGSIGWRRAPLKTILLSAADIKAIPFVIHLLRGLVGAGQPAGRRLPLAAPAGAVRGLRRRHRPGDLRGVRLRRRRAAPAGEGRPRRADARPGVPRARSARTTRAKYGPRVWHRDFFDADIVACPDASVIGKSFGQVGVERGGAAPGRRVPRPRPRARHRAALADHDLQPPPRAAGEDRPRARRADGLLRRRRPPAQHGLLQLRAPAAQARPRRRGAPAGRS